MKITINRERTRQLPTKAAAREGCFAIESSPDIGDSQLGKNVDNCLFWHVLHHDLYTVAKLVRRLRLWLIAGLESPLLADMLFA